MKPKDLGQESHELNFSLQIEVLLCFECQHVAKKMFLQILSFDAIATMQLPTVFSKHPTRLQTRKKATRLLLEPYSRPAEMQQEARGKAVIQRPPNLQIVAYVPKSLIWD